MRTQTPIVCTECHRYMHGKSAYLSHSCFTNGVPSPFCIFLYLYSSLTVKTRIFNGKTRAARRLPPFLSVFLLPPPETGPDGHRRLPEPFPTQMVKWPQRRNGLPSHPSYPLSLSLSFFLFTVRRCPPYTFPYTEADDTTEDENGVSVTQGGIAARNDWFRSGCCLSAYLSRYWMSVEATLGGHANGAVSWRSVVTRIQTNRGVFTGGPHRCVWTQIVLPMLAGKFRRFRMVSSTSRDERWNHTTLQTG